MSTERGNFARTAGQTSAWPGKGLNVLEMNQKNQARTQESENGPGTDPDRSENTGTEPAPEEQVEVPAAPSSSRHANAPISEALSY